MTEKSKESELKAKYKMPYERIFDDKKKNSLLIALLV